MGQVQLFLLVGQESSIEYSIKRIRIKRFYGSLSHANCFIAPFPCFFFIALFPNLDSIKAILKNVLYSSSKVEFEEQWQN